MKYKQASVCGTCRAYKLGCDGKRPSCSQCSFTGRNCAGYRLDTVFVPYPATTSPRTPRRVSPTKSSTAKQTKPAPDPNSQGNGIVSVRQSSMPKSLDGTTAQQFAAVILNCYVPVNKQNLSIADTSTTQVCGAWVNILPKLVDKPFSGNLISSAVKTFAAAILERTPEGRHHTFQNFEDYNSTLYHLKGALASPGRLFIETAAAIGCLAMSELLLPTSQAAFDTHLNGLGALIESHPPSAFSSDVFHAVFVGSRPLLIFQALTARTPTFLAQPRWTTLPFRQHPASDLQRLLGDVAVLPSIPREVDLLRSTNLDDGGGATAACIGALKVRAELLDVLGRLAAWDDRFRSDATHLRPGLAPPPPPVPGADPSRAQDADLCLWFPGLLAANVNVHAWAFEVICLAEMEKVDAVLPLLAEEQQRQGARCCGAELDDDAGGQASGEEAAGGGTELRSRMVELAVKVCRSMEYLMQDETRLFGPASAIFPLQVAYDALDGDRRANAREIRRCRAFFERIRCKGYQARKYFPVDDNSVELTT